MRTSELGKRYAKAVFELAVDNRTQAKVFDDLRALNELFSDKTVLEFLTSPLVPSVEKEKALKAAIGGKGAAQEVVDLVMLLARKDRLAIFSDIVRSFEAEIDAANNVSRGTVRSATTLAPAERQRLEQTIEKTLNKKVILTYKVDPAVIGGLVAEVGSYTFDDSITSHLRRMNEDLKRRTV